MRKAIVPVLVIALWLSLPVLAEANQLDLFGFNARATGLANAYTAIADGPEATFYNPGELITSNRITAFAGYSYSLPGLSVDLLNRDETDISETPELKQAKLPAAGQWINAGVSGGLFDRVYLGLGMQVPVDGASRRRIFSPDRPYFLKYDTGIFGLTFIPAVGVKVAPNYGIGLGARITMDPLGTFWTEVPTASGEFRATTLATSQFTAQAAPIAGFYARPFEYLRFGLAFIGQSYAYYHKTMEEKLVASDPAGTVEIEYEVKYNFNPRRFVLGVAGQPDEHVLITAELDWVGWSAYVPPYPSMRLDFSHMNEAGLSYQRPQILEREDAEFDDTWEPHFGVEVKPYKFLSLRAGYSYQPSPVPDQQGTTTILDATTNVIAFGAGGNFLGPHGDLVTIDLSMMDHIISKRWFMKETSIMQEEDPSTNPSFPRVTFRGQYFYSSLTATFRF